MLTPLLRAVGQLDDPAFLGVVARSLIFSVVAFAALVALAVWGLHALVPAGLPVAWAGGALAHWLGWAAGLAGAALAGVAAMWLFMPAAVGIAALFTDSVAEAVDRRWYPWLPQPRGAPLSVQIWDGLWLAGVVLLLNLAGLVATVLLSWTGIGLVLGWVVAAWAIGRGLFVAVAMRRMPRPAAQEFYRHHRGPVLATGAALALAAHVPLLNLLVPVIGTAAMVHVLHGES